jgi:hypothetical protein
VGTGFSPCKWAKICHSHIVRAEARTHMKELPLSLSR